MKSSFAIPNSFQRFRNVGAWRSATTIGATPSFFATFSMFWHDGYPAVWSPTGTLTKFTAQAGYEDSFNVRVYAASNNGNLVGVSNESHTSTTIHWFYALA